MEILENNKTVLVKGNVIGFENSTLEPSKYLVQFPDLTTASLSVDMIEDEPQGGRADEAPRYVKNILARLRELPLHDREVWLKAIMAEFEQDFSHAKWREGYEQGKFEASMIPYSEPQKPVIPQFVADWIERSKQENRNLRNALNNGGEKMRLWFLDQENYDLFARAWLDGYEVKKEKQYEVKIKASGQYLAKTKQKEVAFMYNGACSHFTRKELEDAGFGWVFDCEGIEVEEVEE